jgi:hypothetical protein
VDWRMGVGLGWRVDERSSPLSLTMGVESPALPGRKATRERRRRSREARLLLPNTITTALRPLRIEKTLLIKRSILERELQYHALRFIIPLSISSTRALSSYDCGTSELAGDGF